jgi:hypothetical protein
MTSSLRRFSLRHINNIKTRNEAGIDKYIAYLEGPKGLDFIPQKFFTASIQIHNANIMIAYRQKKVHMVQKTLIIEILG